MLIEKKIVIVGGARDYHAMDWYRVIQQVAPHRKILFLTDLIAGEGFEKILTAKDKVKYLFVIDKLLLSKQSTIGNIWRNFIKIAILPLQVVKLRSFAHKHPQSIYHAHPMYYMLLCWLAGVEFIGTPQGSEILVRPNRSRIYKYFAIQVLRAAKSITVDSQSMQDKIFELSERKSILIQNGIDMDSISKLQPVDYLRDRIISFRGMTPLYQIKEIVTAREHSNNNYPLTFIYPFWDIDYKSSIKEFLQQDDIDLGRLAKDEMFQLLSETMLAISIPKSDSSPRSVYEAIFSGCCVAVTNNRWIDAIPPCMKKRLFIVDLSDTKWFDKAIEYAQELSTQPYRPSQEALAMFDQTKSMAQAVEILYK